MGEPHWRVEGKIANEDSISLLKHIDQPKKLYVEKESLNYLSRKWQLRFSENKYKILTSYVHS